MTKPDEVCIGTAADEAAVTSTDASGQVHVNGGELATRRGARGGAAVGALAGISFPPSILASAAIGAAAGGGGGHRWNGGSRTAVQGFGETKLEAPLEQAQLQAARRGANELDLSAKEADAAVQETAQQVE